MISGKFSMLPIYSKVRHLEDNWVLQITINVSPCDLGTENGPTGM